METTEIRDEKLWRTARKRAAFKRHLLTYIVINIFLWAIWFIRGTGFPWPVWVTLGWGIGLTFNYFGVYKGLNDSLADKEYEKLKNKSDL